MVDEQTLLRRLQKQDPRALEQAIDRYTPYLSTVLYRTAGPGLPREDIEEIVSDVFVCLWQNAGRIQAEKGGIRPYLAAAARNFAFKRLGRQHLCESLDEVEIAGGPGAAEELAERETLWGAVMELGEPESELFVRYYRYGQTLQEIAGATGLKLSTVKTKLSRGKKKLKTILQAEESL